MQNPCERNIPQQLSRTLELCDASQSPHSEYPPRLYSAFYLCTTPEFLFPELMAVQAPCWGFAISLGSTGNPVVAKLNDAINCKLSQSLVFNAVKGVK